MNQKKNKLGIFVSFFYAFQGIKQTFITENNFKVHCFATLVVLVIGYCFNLNLNEWFFILLAIALVLSAELFNTAIEQLTDMITEGGYDPRAKKIKDASAAAVLLIALFAVIVGITIFADKILAIFD